MTSHPRSDPDEYKGAAMMSHAELVTALRAVLGAKLVAYLGGVNATAAGRLWAEGVDEIDSEAVVERLRVVYRATRLIIDRDTAAVAEPASIDDSVERVVAADRGHVEQP